MRPLIETLNTSDLPFEDAVLAQTTARHAGEVVVVDIPGCALTAEPANEVNSLPELAVTQRLDPFVPFAKSEPDPMLATNDVGEFGEAAAAVPPFAVVWKSHPAMTVCARASPAKPTATHAARAATQPRNA